MTPRQFGLLAERHQQRSRMEDRRAGEIVAILYNINVDRKRNPKGITWQDVFPEYRPLTPAQSEEQMLGTMRLWAAVTKSA